MKIAISGACGRMGQTLIRASLATQGCTLAAAAERGEESAVRATLAALGAHAIPLARDAGELFSHADAVIDFTAPANTLKLAAEAARTGKVHVIGTTGLEPAEQEAVAAAAQTARIVQSANYSLGVNVLEALVEQAARLLADDYDIEVDEMHHALKKDSPSGTAIMLARAAAKGRQIDLEKNRVHYGEGIIGERRRGTIGMSARRGGEVVGVHTVTLAGRGENLELTHRAGSRDIYAHGAIRAALWAQSQPPGLYSMRDVLGI